MKHSFIERKLLGLLDAMSGLICDNLYLRIKFRLMMHRKLHLRNPRTFNERLQWQKLYDRNPLYHSLVDKIEVKSYVGGKIGEKYVIPTLGVWDSASEIKWDLLPEKFVIKCTHDSGSTVICDGAGTFDRQEASETLNAALKVDFSKSEREWAYKGVKPRIIAEQYLGDNISDYKFFCFDGVPKFMFVASDRQNENEETKFDFFDMDYNWLDVRNGHPNAISHPAKPENFELMKDLASVLSKGISQVRVDFYEVGGKVYFGEYTFYHWGGFVPFEPEAWDKRFLKWAE